jgi:hypothetical protein
MPSARDAWGSAFAVQSRSDWQAYDRLAAEPRIPICHELHYLQMACEKIAKAYRCRDTAANLEELLARHVGFSKFMGSFLASPCLKEAYKGRDAQRREVAKLARALAREIEKLAPAIDRVASPENAEYPWQSGENIVAPCQYDYPQLSLLMTAGGRTFLKLVTRAIEEFEPTPTPTGPAASW